mgnify:CR=1 FL=1
MVASPILTAGSFNPRSPRGERRVAVVCLPEMRRVSIHAPRAGSDPPLLRSHARLPSFNPRSPRGERRSVETRKSPDGGFNPRSPRGERRVGEVMTKQPSAFQSTLPARGATPPV